MGDVGAAWDRRLAALADRPGAPLPHVIPRRRYGADAPDQSLEGVMGFQVVVDFDKCESNALCMGVAPEVFEVRDDDFLYVLAGGAARGVARASATKRRASARSRPSRSSTPSALGMHGNLDGKAALVTGGGSGIGLGAARRLAANGAHVTIAGRTEARLAEAVTEIAADAAPGATVQYAVCDVTVEDDVVAAVAARGRTDRRPRHLVRLRGRVADTSARSWTPN